MKEGQTKPTNTFTFITLIRITIIKSVVPLSKQNLSCLIWAKSKPCWMIVYMYHIDWYWNLKYLCYKIWPYYLNSSRQHCKALHRHCNTIISAFFSAHSPIGKFSVQPITLVTMSAYCLWSGELPIDSIISLICNARVSENWDCMFLCFVTYLKNGNVRLCNLWPFSPNF